MKYSSTMRLVLEIRFFKKQFSFIDHLGMTTDKLTKELDMEKVSIKNSRIDLASDNLDKIFFFTVENTGIQIEAANNLDVLQKSIEQLETLANKKLVDINSVARIGVKASTLTHCKGKGFDATKQLLTNHLFSGLPAFNKSIGIKSNDVGYILQDAEIENYKIHSQIGPVSFEEAASRFFDQKNELYQGFGYDNGLFVDIDVFDDTINYEPQLSELFGQIRDQVETIEKIHEKILKFVFESNSNE